MNNARLTEVFVAESREHIGDAHLLLARLATGRPEEPVLRALLRHSHSLKGMSATLGLQSMVELSHAMEDVFQRMLHEAPADPAAHAELLCTGLTCIEGIVTALEKGTSTGSSQAEEIARELLTLAGAAADDSPRPETLPSGQDSPPSHSALEPPTSDPEAIARRWRIDLLLSDMASGSPGAAVSLLSRIGDLGRVEQAGPPKFSHAGEPGPSRLSLVLASNIERAELELELLRATEVNSFSMDLEAPALPRPAVARAAPRWARVRADLLDTLLERSLDLMFEQSRAGAAVERDAKRARDHLQRSQFLLRELHEHLMELRLVPLDAVTHRLHQTVRKLSCELRKEVSLQIVGGEIRLDRSMLDALVDPLQHMLRNAIDHGIETADERRDAGKSCAGKLTLEVRRIQESLRIALEDDGRGLDPNHLRRVAVKRGTLDEPAARRLSDRDALQLITRPSFTTMERVTRISGRGVGMDVVRSAVEGLGGHLELRSVPGVGTRIELWLPLTLALLRVLLVRSCGELFALPLSLVQATLEPEKARTALASTDGKGRAGGMLLLRLDEQLGLPPGGVPGHGELALMLDIEGRKIGLIVDEVLGLREIVVRPLPPALAAPSHYSGAALLEDGTIALVLDPHRWTPSN